MFQRSLADYTSGGRTEAYDNIEKCDEIRSVTVSCHSNPSQSRLDATWIVQDEEISEKSESGEDNETNGAECRDTICDVDLRPSSYHHYMMMSGSGTRNNRNSVGSTCWSSLASSRPNTPPLSVPSRPSLTSTVTSMSAFTILDAHTESKSADGRRRPSILTRLKSPKSTTSGGTTQRRGIQISEFRLLPEYPERRFIDSVGMVIPGVCDRSPCSRCPGHFVHNWRLSEPTEYTTALADHGITYTDYTRLMTALEEFVDEAFKEVGLAPKEKQRRWNLNPWRRRVSNQSESVEDRGSVKAMMKRRLAVESAEHFKRTELSAVNLNKLLSDISRCWQERGLPVMVCIGSYSLFSPNRMTEATVQILHVSPLPKSVTERRPSETKAIQRLSCQDPSPQDGVRAYEVDGQIKPRSSSLDDDQGPDDVTGVRTMNRKGSVDQSSQRDLALSGRQVSVQHFPRKASIVRSQDSEDHRATPSPKRRSISPPPPNTSSGLLHHHQQMQMQLREKSHPWPLWPNAIPLRKRGLIKEHADRYGADPYFRAWMRANVNSRTRSTSYAKYMIEREDDPFINKRLEYVQSSSKMTLTWALLTGGYKKWKQHHPNVTNRDSYEHNRRLEVRRTVEQGSRLRIARFAFRRPMYPPHTQEMAVLGLSGEAYEEAIHKIEAIRNNLDVESGKCGLSSIPSLNRFCRRTAESAIPQIIEYFKELNAREKSIVWTIEEIPGVYDQGLGRNGKEWEISAWNGNDGLELVLQLEKWGIVKQRLTNDDDE